MVRSRAWGCVTLVAALLSSCAIAPVQEEVTGVSTAFVVQSIRCETRRAIRDQIGELLVKLDKGSSKDLGKKMLNHKIPLEQIDLRSLPEDVGDEIARYRNYAVALDFSLDGTVSNDLGGDYSITDTFKTGNRQFPFSASFARSRQNIQSFRTNDTFGFLLRELDPAYCDNYPVKGRNYIYPIAGNIGIKDQLQQFVSLNRFGHLSSAISTPGGPPVFTSKLTFSTSVDGSILPTITSTAAVGRISRSGGYGLTSKRIDVHGLTIGFAANTSEPNHFEKMALLAPRGAETGNAVRQSASRTIEQDAADRAVDENILRYEIGRQSTGVVINQSIFSLQ